MYGSTRWMWLRIPVWIVIIVAVTFMMRRPELGDEVGRAALDAMGMAPTPEWSEVVRPPGTLDADQAGEASAVLQLVETLDRACLPSGTTLRLVVDRTGLRSASIRGYAPACAPAALWSVGWPALATPFELEITRP